MALVKMNSCKGFIASLTTQTWFGLRIQMIEVEFLHYKKGHESY